MIEVNWSKYSMQDYSGECLLAPFETLDIDINVQSLSFGPEPFNSYVLLSLRGYCIDTVQ